MPLIVRSGDARHREPSPPSVWAGALVTFALVFAYRWLTVNFTNDQFVPLSRAQQILLGDLPVRDFFDPGQFLHYYASAAALYLSGGTLLGEAVHTIAFTALGSALVYVMATRVSQSWVIGTVAAMSAAMTFPRLYSYPKVFLFVLAVTCAWRYRFRPSFANLALLAGVTALAFLLRHDHGAYIGGAAVSFLILLHWPGSEASVRPLAYALGRYIGVTLVLVLPFLVFIQSSVGIPRYLTSLSSQAREITTFRVNAPPFRFDWTQPLVRIEPASERRINVRWKAGISDETRRDQERQHGLSRAIEDEGTTWSYVITNTTHENIASLVKNPLVDDTNGIDTQRAELANRESLFRRAQRASPVLRSQVAPGVLTISNALAWLYYVTLALPAVALFTLIVVQRKNIDTAADRNGERAIVGMLIVLCAILGQSLVRESPETRLPDVAAPLSVLAAWVAGVWTRRGLYLFRARMTAAIAFGVITLWGAAAFGELSDRIVTSGALAGPAGLTERVDTVNDYLTTSPPIDGWDDTGSIGLRALARWVRACTVPSDRLLVVGWASDLFFYAERPFAGGQVYLYPDWHSSVADQQLTVERLSRQRVPIAISPVEGQPATRKAFPIVLDYVDRHYSHAMRSTFGSSLEYDVLIRRDIPPVGTYEPLRLPCYR